MTLPPPALPPPHHPSVSKRCCKFLLQMTDILNYIHLIYTFYLSFPGLPRLFQQVTSFRRKEQTGEGVCLGGHRLLPSGASFQSLLCSHPLKTLLIWQKIQGMYGKKSSNMMWKMKLSLKVKITKQCLFFWTSDNVSLSSLYLDCLPVCILGPLQESGSALENTTEQPLISVCPSGSIGSKQSFCLKGLPHSVI